ncbi:MAG: hypothetical protein RMK15_02035 [Chloroflexota bacterium]|jgi:hypothetical protein|nr:hypothetical protein [Dehalococcoidia bacterium]MDW8046045.1 hypothetical protein [Chloroflexota bacterium]
MSEPRPRPPDGSPAIQPVLIVVPSLISGAGLVFVLIALFVDHPVIRPLFLSLGLILLWLDFFVTMAIFRYYVRSIDRRLRRIEARLPD